MFDYIIVGGGSAGSILANRLSEDPKNTVLLIEAGKADSSPNIRIPAAFSRLFRSEADWDYYTTPQKMAGARRMYQPRGRVLGGSSSINAMIYIRGNHLDYDHWADLGNKGWSYEELLPYFKEIEDQQRGADAYHGAGGPWKVADQTDPHPVSRAFIEGAEELGFDQNPDFNGSEQEGFGLYQVNQENGKRVNAARAFVHPVAKRKNLTVMTGLPVTRLVLERQGDQGHRCIGIEYQLPTHKQMVRAGREVILAAGAFNSPQLLMLSGVGPEDELRSQGIRLKHELPGVGQNLQDHLVVPMCYRNKDHRTLESAESITSLVNFLIWGEGPLSSNIAEAGGFIRTSPDLRAPDIQYHFAPGFFLDHGFTKTPEGHFFTFAPTLLQPESIGQVGLNSAKPFDPPRIDPNYLSAEPDVNALLKGFRIGLEIVKTAAMQEFFDGYYFPSRELKTDQEIIRHIRDSAETLYHPVGTCKMGNDEMAVVDDRLRVHGISGLRVVDASVMPRIVRGNTNAPTMAIATKAAHLILEDQSLGIGKNSQNALSSYSISDN